MAPSPNLKLSIIVPTSGERNFVHQLIPTIEHQDFSSLTEDLEVIIVVNGQTKNFELIKNEFLKLNSNLIVNFHFIDRKNVSMARNKGAELAKGEVLYFLDDDCIFHRAQHITEAYEAAKGNQQSIIGGTYLLDGRSPFDDFYNRMCNLWVESHRDAHGAYHTLLGGNFFAHHSIFENIRFNESFDSGAEETDFFQRASDSGIELSFSDQFSISHLANKNMKNLMETATRQGYAKPKSFQGQYQRDWKHLLGHLKLSDLKYLRLGADYYSKVLIHSWINK